MWFLQFENPANIEIKKTTALEIIKKNAQRHRQLSSMVVYESQTPT
jgi:cysteine synthase